MILENMQALVWSILGFALVLSPLVFIHELAHYSIARLFGISIEVFSIGFGPSLCEWKDKSGTRWKIGCLPFGGYVQPTDHSEQGSGLSQKAPWKRICVALAGPASNYGVTLILLVGLFTWVGVPQHPPIIQVVGPVARAAGLESGDLILGIQQTEVKSFQEIVHVLGHTDAHDPLHIVLERNGNAHHISVPSLEQKGVWFGRLGIAPSITKEVSYQPISLTAAIKDALRTMNPVQMIKALSSDTIARGGGPIAIAHSAGHALQQGLISLLFFTASLSLALGFFNLLPVPALDGGLVLFAFIEMIIRRPLPQKLHNVIVLSSFALLIALFVFICWQDLQNIPTTKAIIDTLRSLF